MEGVDVFNPETMQPDPADGATMGLGEIRMREQSCNEGIRGYYHLWWLEHRYVEVENTLYQQPAIFKISVVARPREKWGETPCAFVTLKAGVDNSDHEKHLAEDIMKFCRSKLPAYSVPRSVVFGPWPKTATVKIQKHLLRAKAKELGSVSMTGVRLSDEKSEGRTFAFSDLMCDLNSLIQITEL
ncbi:hypothetical protein C1H46_006381 [Malus baccata]|uniref:AMP-binding enzyme C-terminal domain-containing protein n=1 Tax=Malus baccata TaxID=106549 RepID=A0A540NBK8_MALBA|nr:hypothetical protein C1H46_006381 [Malus baccata]